MTREEIEKRLSEYQTYQKYNGADEELVNAMELAVQHVNEFKDPKFTIDVAHKAMKVCRDYLREKAKASFEQIEQLSQKTKQGYKIINQYYNCMRYAAKYELDSFCLYVERYRPRKERFYEPRRFRLKEFVNDIQALEDNQLDELYLHCPPRIGKSQLVTMACAWHCARNDELSNLYITYSNTLGGAFLDGVMEIIKDPTYAFSEVFPGEEIVHTDSEAHRMNMTRRKKYATLSGRGMEAGLNGQFDAKGWLILDDLHEGINEVLNPDLLRKKLIFFKNNVLTRKLEGCKILAIGTIWSLNDIFMNRHAFLESGQAKKGTRYRIHKIPAMNEKDESNFAYKCDGGFSTEEYRSIRAGLEDIGEMSSWMAQYMQEPIERDGALFKPEDMRYYNGILPAEKPLKVVCACDVALGGDDYLSFPVAYVYEDGSVYIDDVVYDNSEKKFTKPQVIEKIIEHRVTRGYFESNQGGEGYKDEVCDELRRLNYKISLTSEYAPTDKRKADRILDKAGSIREYYFRDAKSRNKQYKMFMINLFSFNFKTNQKHKHQDAADSLASLAYYLEGTWGNAKVEAVLNPFRRKQYGY